MDPYSHYWQTCFKFSRKAMILQRISIRFFVTIHYIIHNFYFMYMIWSTKNKPFRDCSLWYRGCYAIGWAIEGCPGKGILDNPHITYIHTYITIQYHTIPYIHIMMMCVSSNVCIYVICLSMKVILFKTLVFTVCMYIYIYIYDICVRVCVICVCECFLILFTTYAQINGIGVDNMWQAVI